MSYELEGVVERIGETKNVSEKFSVREFAVKTTKTWTSKDGDSGSKEVLVGMQCTGRTTEALDKIKVGQAVTVKFDLEGREYNGRIFTNINAWYVGAKEGGKSAPVQATNNEPENLPF